MAHEEVTLTFEQDHWVGRFVAMACPCEVLIDTQSEDLARTLLRAIAGVCNATRTQTIAQRKCNIIRFHDLANIFEVRI